MVTPRDPPGIAWDDRMRRPLLWLLAAALLMPLTLPGCASERRGDHYDRALAIERELLRRNPEIDYSHPSYVSVLRELRRVSRSSPDRGRADSLTQRISDGRRIALTDSHPQVDHLPSRLRGAEAPRPARAGGPSPPAPPPRARAAGALGELTAAQREQLDITLYSTTWCGYCNKARRYFADRGWDYVEKDVEKDPGAGAEFRRYAGPRGGVPVIVINGQVLRGFSQTAIDDAVAVAVRGG